VEHKTKIGLSLRWVLVGFAKPGGVFATFVQVSQPCKIGHFWQFWWTVFIVDAAKLSAVVLHYLVWKCRVIREQWIRAKYERQEFVNGAKHPYLSGKREGYLWKRGKAAKNFQRRLFILDSAENTLRYYIKEDVSITFTFVFWSSDILSLAMDCNFGIFFAFCFTFHFTFLLLLPAVANTSANATDTLVHWWWIEVWLFGTIWQFNVEFATAVPSFVDTACTQLWKQIWYINNLVNYCKWLRGIYLKIYFF